MSLFKKLFGRWGNSHYARGMMHFNRQEYALAAEAFEQLVAEVNDPSNPDVGLATFYAAEAHIKLGLSYFKDCEYSSARREFEAALGVEASFPDVHFYLGAIAEEEGRYEDAWASLQQALELNNHYNDALAYQAIVAFRMDNEEEARKLLTALGGGDFALPKAFNPDSPIESKVIEGLRDLLHARAAGNQLLASAIEFVNQGNLIEAAQSLRMALAQNRDYPELHCRLGEVRMAMGQYPEAVLCFEEALGLNPRYEEALMGMAEVLIQDGREREAKPYVDRILEISPDHPWASQWIGAA
ncbi:MAG: tetratricopeptide repeat protein [Candidatus Eisenbacteria bacterium]|uniref:Tetratricopeptide repeat protein n=1 Tax=Eiseniibacteriota bacterium TaxID=2212470 RepID=A0A7Y2H0T3_UNCEI|nr:tetratricopeptide repeat protein [Candidatus Eisenbacteria bacterium]